MVPERAKLHIALTFLQFCHAGNHIFLRIALNTGVSKLVLPVYRNITALVLLGPLAYFLEKQALTDQLLSDTIFPTWTSWNNYERRILPCRIRKHITYFCFCYAELCSSPDIYDGCTTQKCRYESVQLNRIHGVAKVTGVLASVGGALVITVYNGPTIYTPHLSLHQKQFLSVLGDATAKNWNLGCICLFGHCLSWSGWIVMQAFVLKKYSAPLTVSAFTCFFGVLQFMTIAAFFVKDSKAWQLNSSSEIYSILYAGVVISALAAAIQIWTISKGGPVFASIYLPLQTLLVALMASILLGEEFFLGGIIGAFLIISGLYLVVWGKSEETKFAKEVVVPIEPKNHPEEKCDISSLIHPLIPTQKS